MSVVRHVQNFLTSARDGDEGAPDRPRVTSHLYRCDPCGETYISTEMERCPGCERSVETIPSERDLGYVSSRSR